jgi:hypothetical protein
MSQEQEDCRLLEILENIIKRAQSNSTCIYSQCQKRPMSSHIIARKILVSLAEGSHIFMWLEIFTWDMRRTAMNGRLLDALYEESSLIGIRDAKVKFPLFCEKHDSQIFAPFEGDEFSFQPEQIMLLAYRALCCMTLSVSGTSNILPLAACRREAGVCLLSFAESISDSKPML